MSFVAVAIGGAGILGAGASIYGAQKGAEAQRDAAGNAINAQQSMFNQAKGLAQPFIDFGQSQLPTLNKLLTPGADQTATLQQLPGFQFGQQWGQKAITNQGTAQGFSGNTLRAGADYATGSASQYFDNYVNQLMKGAGIGQSAATGVGTNAAYTGKNMGDAYIGAGNATAAADVASGNAVASGVNNLTNSYLQNTMLNKLLAANGGGGA